jgi:hypothetical protein
MYIALPVTDWLDHAVFSKVGKKGSPGGPKSGGSKRGGKARESREETAPVPAD